MNKYDVKIGIEPKDDYEKARLDIYQALDSISKLSISQQQQLARELLGEEKYRFLFSLFQRGIQ